MGREVGSYEAKTRLPELLRDVARGEHITITLHGRPVAELAPPDPRSARVGHSTAQAEGAIAAMLDFDLVKGVDALTLARWVDEGRR
ncbi:MAG: type II toxin-antitoxin system prevent-host-death family antitoxin [Phenylobacterium sp.]|nr:type II toxin-antitoxin system prevent-host-death family antitoxin [Phenylobacterium sp.]